MLGLLILCQRCWRPFVSVNCVGAADVSVNGVGVKGTFRAPDGVGRDFSCPTSSIVHCWHLVTD